MSTAADTGAADAASLALDATDAVAEDVGAADAAPVDAAMPQNGGVTVKVPFTAEKGGAPMATVDPSALVSLQWQIALPAGGCSASVTISNVSFY